ncbi:uracil-DNA glycosylase family protein [Sphingosinicella sp. CPCC 101087]|uniref:uracil-DNA glycosylase family protein n=1 Tax=Sphingosinicella sp. CPCC 101087 TaxID=2497754 RepID=UPI00101D286C|nr:uracil-DNA glycosylase family protein [Sphingosinicella sp. CPCC 101087]
MPDLDDLLAEIRACRACAEYLPLGPRPVLQAGAGARILVASQAPGTRVHTSGVPFDDPSGDRLRAWLGVTRAQFHDPRLFAIVPMGFCYPGRGAGGDSPPRPECAQLWRDRLLSRLPSIDLVLLVGSHAQQHVLGKGSMTDRVRRFRDHLPLHLPLPHPSWRSRLWEARNPWFGEEVIPELRRLVAARIGDIAEGGVERRGA